MYPGIIFEIFSEKTNEIPGQNPSRKPRRNQNSEINPG